MKRYVVTDITEEGDEYKVYSVLDKKTKTLMLKPTEFENTAIVFAGYLNTNVKNRIRPSKPKRIHYQQIIPI